MMDPHTGEILALSGKQYAFNEEKNKYEFNDFAAGNFTTSYAVGSAVKGATVLTGYMTGVYSPGATLLDEPLTIKDTNSKSSWFNRAGGIWISDKKALERSSNVYMFKTAIAIGDGKYRKGQSLIIDKEKAFRVMRDHFGQFGLGIRTGIDLPGEQNGFRGSLELADAGNVLDFSIGQYDTYTPLQLAQYVSTIANGGYRIQPRVVKEIRDPGEAGEDLGPLAQEMKPKVLNKVDASARGIKQVQEGFWNVFHGPQGTGIKYFNSPDISPLRAAGKTGTAETRDRGRDVWNVTLVAYAPYEDPEIAMSVIVPSAYLKTASSNNINMEIGQRALKAYFDLKEKRAAGGDADDKENQDQAEQDESEGNE